MLGIQSEIYYGLTLSSLSIENTSQARTMISGNCAANSYHRFALEDGTGQIPQTASCLVLLKDGVNVGSDLLYGEGRCHGIAGGLLELCFH